MDARGHEDEFSFYCYGGTWKNRCERYGVRKPKSKRASSENVSSATTIGGRQVGWREGLNYTKNDRMMTGD